jgi:thiamine pyrophosphokinase
MHILIFSNGQLAGDLEKLPPHDLRIAADGGTRHLSEAGLQPDVIVGDLDSLPGDILKAARAAQVEIIAHPQDKDETDLELALDLACARGAREITLYGLLGGRWDMTIANLFLLASPAYMQARIRAVHGAITLYVLRGGETLHLTGTPGDRISVIPAVGPAAGITYEGLAWPLENARLPFGSPRGVSNHLAGSQAVIRLQSGTIFCIHDSAHLPREPHGPAAEKGV